MANLRIKPWLLATLLLACSVSLLCLECATAQQLQPFGPTSIDTDMQLFAPAELGSFGERPAPHEGYFFTYDKINWSTMGQKNSVGVEGAGQLVPVYYPGGPIATPSVTNSFSVSLPDADFGWGDRYQVGYMEGRTGWLAGVLSGPDDNQEFIIDSQNNPQGSVVLVFSDPTSQMFGFIDRFDATNGNPQQGGVAITGVGDGLADDIDGDGVHGPDGLDTDGDGVPDDITVGIDWDDLVQQEVRFQTANLRTETRVDGVELMKMHRFRPFHGGSYFEVHWGARYMRFKDLLGVVGTAGTNDLAATLDDSFFTTTVINNLVGPQVSGRWVDTRGRWTFNVSGRFMAAVNVQNADLNGVLDYGQGGQLNHSYFLSTTSFKHNRRDVTFSPLAELRVETAYQVTKSFALKLGYTGVYASNITRASTANVYVIPDMALRPGGHDEFFTNGVNFGVEFNR